MKFSMLLPPAYDARKWAIAKQIGVNHAITKAASDLSGLQPPYHFESLRKIQENFKKDGIELIGLEGDQFDMSPIKLGLPNKDESIEKYIQMLKNMGRLGINLLCYNFMATIGWYRTRTDVHERGGAYVSAFLASDVTEEVPKEQQISEEKLWENLLYFLEAVLPIAEENGIQMALHPDDPPISPLKGVGRILTSYNAFDRIIQKFDSPSNGITFCQATFALMEGEMKEQALPWFKEKKVFFLHLRDIQGNKYDFRETFHDNGTVGMKEMLEFYHKHNFDGPLRPDHAPSLYGETNEDFSGGISTGYEVLGKIYAIGYLKGIMDQANIHYL